jgi:outer membrane protein
MNKLLPLVALLAATTPALAQQPEAPRWTVGALVIDRNAPYRDLDEGLLVVPLVRFEGERAYLRGLRGGVRLVESPGYELAVFGQARLDGYDSKDSPYLAGMDDRRASLDLGLASTWTSQRLGALELSAAADVLDRSGGYELAASWTGRFAAGAWTFFPGASVRWQDEKMLDYYFGVRAAEAVPGRAAYSADAAVTPDVSLLATRDLGKRWSVFARASHAWLPSEITDSPLVDRSGNTSLMLGVGYSLD